MPLQRFYVLLALFFSLNSVAQNPYEKVDSIMRAYPNKVNSEEDLWRLSYFIRHNFQEDSVRLRAAVIWITENIAYDIKAFQAEDPKASQISYVVKKKKAICSGYAALLKYFCDSYKIENEIVTGRSRSLNADIYITNTRFKSTHAWNAVKINNQWRLIDATWAAGVIIDEDESDEFVKAKYQRQFEETYYFTPPDRIALNHYPSDLRYSFTSTKLPDYKDFVQAPFFTTRYLQGSLQAVSPKQALQEANVGDTITFRFRSSQPIYEVSFFSKREKANYVSEVGLIDGWYQAKYPVAVPGFYNLNIALNNERAAAIIYKLRVVPKY